MASPKKLDGKSEKFSSVIVLDSDSDDEKVRIALKSFIFFYSHKWNGRPIELFLRGPAAIKVVTSLLC